jgi:hypothetical protein
MHYLEVLWELLFLPILIDVALLPQLFGLGAFWFLKSKSLAWARVALVLLPAFLFCILWWIFIRSHEAACRGVYTICRTDCQVFDGERRQSFGEFRRRTLSEFQPSKRSKLRFEL